MPDPWTLLFVSFLSRFFFPSLSSFSHIPLLVSLCLFFPSPVVFQNFSCFGRTLIESARSGGGRIGAKVSWVEHTSVSLLSGGTLQSQADGPPRERDRCTPAVQPPAGEASRGLPTADVPRELCPLMQCPPTLCPLTLEDTSHTHTHPHPPVLSTSQTLPVPLSLGPAFSLAWGSSQPLWLGMASWWKLTSEFEQTQPGLPGVSHSHSGPPGSALPSRSLLHPGNKLGGRRSSRIEEGRLPSSIGLIC